MSITRLRAVVGRWADVGLLALAAYAATILVVAATRPCAKLVALPSWLWIPGLALALVSLASTLRSHPRALLGLRHFGFYPPPWLATLGALGLVFAHLRLSPALLNEFGCPSSLELPTTSSLVTLGLSVASLALVGWATVRALAARSERAMALRAGPDQGTEAPSLLEGNALFEWIASDAPVRGADEDYFGHSRLARRVADHLTASERPTVALVGPVGSGKSSIRLLVERQLARQGHIGSSVVVCRVSLWSFDTNDAAIRGILAAVTDSLAEHISTVALKGLPSEYVDAVESGPGSLAALGKLLRAAPSPEAILRKYDRAATAIGMRVILWLEDLERYAGTTGIELRREMERLAPIRALLTSLGELAAVQVVLATSDTDAQFDMEKLARFVLPIPPLDSREVYRSLVAFRDECHKRKFLDPLQDERETLWPSEDSDDAWELLSIMGALTERRALGLLCGTPRILKQGLRLCKDAWDQLCGEIDFDDLLVISLLRVAEPQVFTLIARHIRELRHGTHSPEGKPDKTVFSSELEGLLSENASSLRRSAVIKLVEFVFPSWRSGRASSGATRLQGIASSHTDYWTRYIRVERPATLEADQRLLEAVLSSRVDFDASLVATLVSGARDEVLEAFIEALLPADRLVPLLAAVVEAEKAGSPRDWKNGADSFGVISVWRMMLRHRLAKEQLLQRLPGLIRSCLPRHLPLAQCLVHYFITPSGQVPSLFESQEAADLRAEFVDAVLEAYRSAPQDLADALRDAADYLLLWVVFGLDRVRSNAYREGVPFPRWQEFSPTLLAAARLSPEVVIPQVVRLLVDRETYIDHEKDGPFLQARFVYREGSAEMLFGREELQEVLRVGREVPSLREVPEFLRVAEALL